MSDLSINIFNGKVTKSYHDQIRRRKKKRAGFEQTYLVRSQISYLFFFLLGKGVTNCFKTMKKKKQNPKRGGAKNKIARTVVGGGGELAEGSIIILINHVTDDDVRSPLILT